MYVFFVLYVLHGGAAMVSQEFTSEANCAQALASVQEMTTSHEGANSSVDFDYIYTTGCKPK
jgi:uncharacterized protein YegP (UPF0339 family)